MNQIFKNNASSRLVQPLAAVDTVLRVIPGEGARFPQPVVGSGDFFLVTVEDRRTGQIEICRCTQRNLDILNVLRAQEGTSALEFAIGATVSNRLTAKTLSDFIAASSDERYVNVTGDTMTGPLAIPGPPTVGSQAANKDYVDMRSQAIGVTIADTPPITAFDGQFWWDSDSGSLYIRYNDGDSQQWVQVNIDTAAVSVRAQIELKNATASVTWTAGAGTPEGVVTATVGSLYTRTDGGANTTLYVKQSGSGNTGWSAK